MNAKLHKSNERGKAEHSWLSSRFSFSFASYYDKERMGFGALRVINDDIIAPFQGFDMHPHENMEIITLVLIGALEHKDSAGNHGIIYPGDLQYMSAGNGVFHSEFSASSEPTTLFQIWIYPHTKGGNPQYKECKINQDYTPNQWKKLVSGNEDACIQIKQNAAIYRAELSKGISLSLPNVDEGVGRLILVVEGDFQIGSFTLNRRDELQITDSEDYLLEAIEEGSVLVFEVPL
jgi:hypothetical protein